MGANMQFNSYFPRCYNSGTLSLDGNGASWPSNPDKKVSENGNSFNTTLLSPDFLLAYNKDLLKQTMLKHEKVFKDQVKELHRVYIRQRELMNERRKTELNSYLKSDASHSSIAFFQAATQYVQKNFQSPGFSNPVPVTVQSPTSLVQGSEDFRSSEPKCKKVGKKFLDLQLPADEYIDCEERYLVNHVDKVSQGSEALSYSQQVMYANGTKSFFGSNVLNPVFNRATETPPSVLQNPNRSDGKLTDRAGFLSNGFLSPAGHNGSFENTQSSVRFSLEESTRNAQKRPHLEVLSDTGRGWDQLSYPDKTGIQDGKLNSFFQGFYADKFPSVSKSLHKDLEQASMFQDGNQSSFNDRNIMEGSGVNFDSLDGNLSGRHGALRRSIFDDHAPQTNNNKNLPEPILIPRDRCESARTLIAVQALPCFSTSTQIGKRYKSSCGRSDLPEDCDLESNNNRLNDLTGSVNFKQPRCSSDFAVSKSIWAITPHSSGGSGSKLGYEEKVNYVMENGWLEDVVPKKTEETCSSSILNTKSKGKHTGLDLNMSCDSASESETELCPIAELAIENGTGLKGKGFGCVIDLNSSVNEADFPQKTHLSLTTEIDSDAPTSPENKECSPPRGESDGNPVDSATNSDPQDDELVRLAAETIVSFSSTALKETLDWFASIASSSLVERALTDDDDDDVRMDYFEAMTLSLAEEKPDKHIPGEKEIGTASLLSPGQQKKSRGRARSGRHRQRKDFQREILPSLVSLSRHEVTEDLQMIGGLMESAAGSGRNRCSRGQKRASEGKTVKEERSVICWGKVTRRRRGQRCPVRVSTQQQLIASQV